MKKIYLCALALSVGSLSFGQRATAVKKFGRARLEAFPQDVVTPVKGNNVNDKAPGSVIWSEDFTGGLPTGWTLVDNTGNSYDWILNSGPIDDTGIGGFTNTTAIASTSGGNYMLLFGDKYNTIAGGTPTDMDSYFQTTAIAITGQPSVSVRFQEKFRLCCSTTAQLNLVVSTDPTFATNVQTFDARGAVALNTYSADPLTKTINISSIAGGLNGNIYLRFHWATGASHYFWMVDDIEVIESINNDLVASNEYYGFNGIPYTKIPVAQIQPADFSMSATNVGAAAQPNTILTVDINAGLFNAVSTPTASLASGATDSLFTGQFTPPATLAVPYNITMTASSDSTDSTPADNVATFPPFEISQYIYAMDDYGTPGNGGGAGPGGATDVEFEAGNYYEAVANDVATAIEVVVGTNAPIGTTIDGVLYSIDTTGTFTEISRSGFYTTTSADAGNAVTLLLNVTPGTMVAGTTYFAAVHTFTEFYYGTSGSSPGPTTPGGTVSLIFYGSMTNPVTGENFYTSRTPMIRLSFDLGVGINKVSENIKFSVSPNPSSDIFNINLDAKTTENVTLSVRNIVGQTVLTKQLTINGATRETISLADYDKGIYFLTIDSNKERKTVKLIVE